MSLPTGLPPGTGAPGARATAGPRSTCPSCGAIVRPGADWCSLCFHDLRPVPPPRFATAVPAGVATAAPGGPAAATAAGAVPSVPCTTCGEVMRVDADTCPSCGHGLFDGLRGTSTTTLRLPVVGDLMRLGRGARGTVAFGLALTLALVLVLLVSLLG